MKKYLPLIITAVLALAVGFWGGMSYAGSSAQNPGARQFANGSFAGRRAAGTAGGGFTAGEIIAKDSKSITVKLQDGGSKLVFFSDATKIMHTTDASSSALAVGGFVAVSGGANSDGSVTADSIQLRPNATTTGR